MRADLNWGFASFMGLGCGVFININSIQSPVGFQGKIDSSVRCGREKRTNTIPCRTIIKTE